MTSLPSPPLLFIAFSTPHRSPLSERLEQAKGCDDSNLCESRKRDVGTLLYLWLVFFDFVKSTENIELPAI